jgi:hypothetical protein
VRDVNDAWAYTQDFFNRRAGLYSVALAVQQIGLAIALGG